MSVGFLLGYAMGEGAAARAVQRAASIPSVSGVSTGTIEDLSERIDRLVLLTAAMWSILEENGATEAELIARVEELDSADAVLDGKLTAKPTPCSGCDTLVAPGLAACQYCGEAVRAVDPPGPFHTI
ncbi:MAG: hypothetical protein M3132_14055 [Actinomycetia bacterium]|nr:hypothetical protein [Actinomycetes bacterium]